MKTIRAKDVKKGQTIRTPKGLTLKVESFERALKHMIIRGYTINTEIFDCDVYKENTQLNLVENAEKGIFGGEVISKTKHMQVEVSYGYFYAICVNVKQKKIIGKIEEYKPFKEFAFTPEKDTVYSQDCLKAIGNAIKRMKREVNNGD